VPAIQIDVCFECWVSFSKLRFKMPLIFYMFLYRYCTVAASFSKSALNTNLFVFMFSTYLCVLVATRDVHVCIYVYKIIR